MPSCRPQDLEKLERIGAQLVCLTAMAVSSMAAALMAALGIKSIFFAAIAVLGAAHALLVVVSRRPRKEARS